MTSQENVATIYIDEVYGPLISEDEARALVPIQKQFMESYLEKKEDVSVEEWLRTELEMSLPEESKGNILQMRDDIIDMLLLQEEKKASLRSAVSKGRSKESWFASEAAKATSYMSTQATVSYLHNLDIAVTSANNALLNTIQTQTGAISQNPNLNGYIAEQYHAQTFNLNAEATGSQYRAKVVEPTGAYAKNSVDIVICDRDGKVVRRYQSKYCKDAKATAQAFEHGDYRGQRKLIPQGQETGIKKRNSIVLEAPDGTTSNPLSKEDALKLQEEAQSGQWNDLNWNAYKTRDLAIGIGKQAGQAAIMGAAMGVSFEVVQKVWNGEEIEGEELLETALVSGADFGVKAATAGALKVGVEKGLITCLKKSKSASDIATISHVAIENVKILGKMATGELSVKEGLEKMEQTTVSTVAGICASAKGAEIGFAIGSIFGPAGAAAGAFVGGAVAHMAGSKVTEEVVKGTQKIRDKAREVAKEIKSKASETVSNVVSEIKNLSGGFKTLLGF